MSERCPFLDWDMLAEQLDQLYNTFESKISTGISENSEIVAASKEPIPILTKNRYLEETTFVSN